MDRQNTTDERRHATREWTPALRLQAIALAEAFPSIPLLAINNFLTGTQGFTESITLPDDAETVLVQLATEELDNLKAYG